MARYGIAIDTEKCMACYNCFMACRDEHCGFETAVSAPQPHSGQMWVRIDSKERGDDSRKIKTSNVATMCAHCADAPCRKAAESAAVDSSASQPPADARSCAVYTRPDGIVIIDSKKAKGLRQIVDACPINAIFWNEELEIPQKCTMCAHLLDEGYEMPRCVEACPNGTLIFGDLDDPDSSINEAIRKGRVTPLQGLAGIDTRVVHLNIPTVFAAGSVYLPDDEPADGAQIVLTHLATGGTKTTATNYFGDWECEWLDEGTDYSVSVRCDGFEEVTLRFTADTDKYLGETILSR